MKRHVRHKRQSMIKKYVDTYYYTHIVSTINTTGFTVILF